MRCRPRSTPRCPTSAAGCRPRPACTARPAGCRGADLVAPLPVAPAELSWDDGLRHRPQRVRRATARSSAAWSTAPSTSGGSTPARATASAAARSACRSSTTARSCCSTGRAASTRAQTTAHELGHAYHNTQLAERTPLQRRCRWRWPRRRASSARRWWSRTASPRLDGADRLALLDVDLAGRQPGRRRHPQPLPVRDRGVRPPPAAHARRRRAQRADARRPGRRVRRRARPVDRAPVHVGASSRTTTARTSTTGRTPTGCCSGSDCSPATATTPSASAPATTTLLSRAGMDTAEELGRGVRPRRHRRGVLGGQPRRAARPHRRLRAPRRLALAPPATAPAVTSSPSCSPASRATASTRRGAACTSSCPRWTS